MIFQFTPSWKGKEREGSLPGETEIGSVIPFWKGKLLKERKGRGNPRNCQVFSKHWINAGQTFVVTWPYCFQMDFPTCNCSVSALNNESKIKPKNSRTLWSFVVVLEVGRWKKSFGGGVVCFFVVFKSLWANRNQGSPRGGCACARDGQVGRQNRLQTGQAALPLSSWADEDNTVFSF